MNRIICIVPLLFAFVLARQNNDTPGDNLNKYVLELTCLAGLRAQMNLEMHASLVYQQMAAHFDSNQVARKGFAKFFQHNSDEEREHAQKIIAYINSRGGTIGNINVGMPTIASWRSAREALQAALDLENKVNNELHGLHKSAEQDCHDPQLQDFLESTFLNEQVESIAQLERLITNLDKFTDTHLGEYFINKDLQ
ncbi:ferritin [Tropilaelaps mercedesae]|uniref:Ferritin n=1 Tax=Tropilaelaps mercedesae TaxID=418985 RepID=A0A1V9Y117_9ACAR|nr:ferritin [Tropilaelaps mercedesae]